MDSRHHRLMDAVGGRRSRRHTEPAPSPGNDGERRWCGHEKRGDRRTNPTRRHTGTERRTTTMMMMMCARMCRVACGLLSLESVTFERRQTRRCCARLRSGLREVQRAVTVLVRRRRRLRAHQRREVVAAVTVQSLYACGDGRGTVERRRPHLREHCCGQGIAGMPHRKRRRRASRPRPMGLEPPPAALGETCEGTSDCSPVLNPVCAASATGELGGRW